MLYDRLGVVEALQEELTEPEDWREWFEEHHPGAELVDMKPDQHGVFFAYREKDEAPDGAKELTMDLETKLHMRRMETEKLADARGVERAMLETLLDIRDQNERVLAKLDEIYMAVPDDSSIKKVLVDLGIGDRNCPNCGSDICEGGC